MPDRSEETLGSFFNIDESDSPLDASVVVPKQKQRVLHTIDRSTLERYATCPAQGVIMDSGELLDSSSMTASGEEVHLALSRTTQEYVDAQGHINKRDLAQTALGWLRAARPDAQPAALQAAAGIVFPWAELIATKDVSAILRFDGGEGDRSGQLAWDIEDLGVRITSEVDLLLGTPSPQVVQEIDYKSGWKRWNESMVRDSFQFQLHAWLIWHNYESVDAVAVRVYETRSRRLTYSIEFRRERDYAAINTRVRSAAGEWFMHAGNDPDKVPTWPTVEKCAICSAAIRCPAALHVREFCADAPSAIDELQVLEANQTYWKKVAGACVDDVGAFAARLDGAIEKITAHMGKLLADKQAAVDAMIPVQARIDALKQLAAQYVDAHGDIVGKSGFAFGRNKPASSRKAQAMFYKPDDNDEDSEQE